MNRKGLLIPYSLVAVQFASLAALLLTGPWLAHHWFWRVLELTGLALGIWAIAAMRLGNFNITPTTVAGGRFVGAGPYRFIRHPMYASLLLTTLPLLADHFTLLRLLFWLLLLVDLILKLLYEEQRLLDHYPEYRSYRQTTRRLIPFIW